MRVNRSEGIEVDLPVHFVVRDVDDAAGDAVPVGEEVGEHAHLYAHQAYALREGCPFCYCGGGRS